MSRWIQYFSRDDVREFYEAQVLIKLFQAKPINIYTNDYCLDEISDYDCPLLFRFNKNDIYKLHSALKLPTTVITVYRHKLRGVDALSMLLRRLSYPNRLRELEPLFKYHFTVISRVCTALSNLIVKKWSHLLHNLSRNKWFTRERQLEFAKAIQNLGAPLDVCIGFIDGTEHAITRPSFDQKELYSGHKKHHCLKYQAIVIPNGIIIHLSLPFPGKRHDAGILKETTLQQQMILTCQHESKQFYVYGDEGYPLRSFLMRPYNGPHLTSCKQKIFNAEMAKVRVSVEWGFGKIMQQFAFLDFRKNLKLHLQPVGTLYTVATLLTNAHTCLYGSQVCHFFQLPSPSLEEYFD